MTTVRLLSGLIFGAALAVGATHALSQDPPNQPDMARWIATTKVQPQHEKLAALIGTWQTEMSIDFGGAPMVSKGTAEARWLYPDNHKWVVIDSQGSMMGQPVNQHQVIGYDVFKQKYVWWTVNSFETIVKHGEGSFLQDGTTLQLWGEMDEPMTGEHDKMVKYVIRFTGPDEHTFEVHDLQINEPGHAVVKVKSTRAE